MGSLENNYAHAFANFEKGAIIMSAELILNESLNQTVGRYNFLDAQADEKIIGYLPADNLFLAMNSGLNMEKAEALTGFLGGFSNSEDEMSLLGVEREKALELFSNGFAVSVNGMKESVRKQDSDVFGEFELSARVPVFHMIAGIGNDRMLDSVLQDGKEKGRIKLKEKYFTTEEEGLGIFICKKDGYFFISNSEPYIAMISEGKKPEQTINRELLTGQAICIYVNLDRDTYSELFRRHAEEKLAEKLPSEMQDAARGLRSLSAKGGALGWEVRLELKDKDLNVLEAMVKSLED